jgi:hypothetical protein
MSERQIMKTPLSLRLALMGGLAFAVSAPGETRYVNVNNSAPMAPYTNWATAATIIQHAVDVALPGDEIVVTNGIYQTGVRSQDGYGRSRVAITKPLIVRSVNGPNVTTIRGNKDWSGEDPMRCVYLTNGAILIGFTLADGLAYPLGANSHFGGGAYCESTNATITNCILRGNSALVCGGAYQGTLNNCTLIENSPGASYYSVLNNSLTISNRAEGSPGSGGGVSFGTLNNCVLTGNSATGKGGAAYQSTLNNCTLVMNSAAYQGGGGFDCRMRNCLVYSNSAPQGANYANSALSYCATEPLPPNGVGNITNAPLFANAAAGNFRLQSNSPCINSGHNAGAPAGQELDGNPRIDGGTVDIGAYEFQSPQSSISYAWLQQSGLPTDGSADYTDPDGDGHNNWQEWRAWTNPTNASAALRLLAPQVSANGILVRWQSVNGQTYFLERSASLAAQSNFVPVASGLMGQPGVTVFTDTNPPGTSPILYRVGVRD